MMVIWRVTRNPIDIAGLTWAPLTLLSAEIRAARKKPVPIAP